MGIVGHQFEILHGNLFVNDNRLLKVPEDKLTPGGTGFINVLARSLPLFCRSLSTI